MHIADIFPAGGRNLAVGDDTFITDVDVANTIGIFGSQNSDRGTIQLGSSSGSFLSGLNGNIGIGTTNPDFRLTVNGKIKAEEIQVVVDVPADYVFDTDYKLQSLEEVESYIKANKHLPGIPDAQSLKTNGWQVGEMNNKLLEKVEELTLYLIELKRDITELKKENELLKKANCEN
jgi:hypothetical protein